MTSVANVAYQASLPILLAILQAVAVHRQQKMATMSLLVLIIVTQATRGRLWWRHLLVATGNEVVRPLDFRYSWGSPRYCVQKAHQPSRHSLEMEALTIKWYK